MIVARSRSTRIAWRHVRVRCADAGERHGSLLALRGGSHVHVGAISGANIISRVQVSHIAQMQNMFDFPPAPKLLPAGRLDPAKATAARDQGDNLVLARS
jgi:hypothetical protein